MTPRGVFYYQAKFKNMSLITYLKDTQGELKHVSWPTRNQAMAFTLVVVIISVFVSFFLGFFDYLLKLVLEKFVI
jgi:preprotein translocase SecE subunit